MGCDGKLTPEGVVNSQNEKIGGRPFTPLFSFVLSENDSATPASKQKTTSGSIKLDIQYECTKKDPKTNFM